MSSFCGRQTIRGGSLALLFFTLLPARIATAHEKWFHDGASQPTCWCTLGSTRTAIALVAVGVLTLLGYLAWRMCGERDVVPGPRRFGATAAGRTAFYRFVPVLLGAHLAVPLFVLGVTGRLLSPNHELVDAQRYFIGLFQIACALAFFYGALTRAAAVVLALIWIFGFASAGWEAMLENVHYLGFAVFFYCCGRGPWSIDRAMFPSLQPSAKMMRFGLPALRVSIGLGLAFVAFTEKLANPALAAAFLQEHHLNFTAALHIPMCDATFALCCGAIELLVGIWLILGLFNRTIILITLIPINMSLTIFHWPELIGHLPFYGALAVLALWTPDEEEKCVFTNALSLNIASVIVDATSD